MLLITVYFNSSVDFVFMVEVVLSEYRIELDGSLIVLFIVSIVVLFAFDCCFVFLRGQVLRVFGLWDISSMLFAGLELSDKWGGYDIAKEIKSHITCIDAFGLSHMLSEAINTVCDS